MSCLRTERIVDEVFELSVEQPMSDAAAKHLAGCEVCQDELDRARRLRAGLRDVKAPQGFAARVAARIATIETSGPARAQRVVSPDPGMELTPTGGWRQRRRFAWGQWLAVAASLMVCGLAWAAVVWLTGDGPPRRAASTSPLVAALTPPTVVQRLEVTVEAPAWCRRGDELVVEPVILASTSLEADLQVTVLVSEPLATIGRASIRAQLRHGVVTPALAFAVGTRGAGRGTVTVVVEPVAREVREWASERFEASTTLEVLEVTREVSLARSAELGGPLSRVTLIPHSDALQLDEPRRASIRVIPGLAAEAELNLRSLVRRPHGCFEQTTAATYVSAMVAKLAADGRTAEDVAVAAQRAAEEGAERLKRFQMPDGGFSLHGRGPSVPWLTALGLAQMADLREVVKVDPERVGAARVALLASRTAEGSFAIPAWRDGRGGPAGPESDLAATAYAAWALLRAGVSADELTETLDWLRASMAQSGEDAYEIAMVARTLIAAGRTGGTQAEQDALDDATDLSARLVELAEVNKRDNALAWRATRTLTGTRGRLAAIETTAL
ncbi:MAG: prenyltransferase/squalene oxidase repeat-containing protein, partial [Planctomycetota bacterium]